MTSSRKVRLALLFGGRSGEHDVSVLSARSVMVALDPAKYDIHPIRIGDDGRWQPEQGVQALARTEDPISMLDRERHDFDVVFPVIHGTYGEDGALQGFLEMAGLPYVGSGVLGSAAGMDKDVTKRLLRDAGVPVVEYLVVRPRDAAADALVERVRTTLGFPCFVKPANLGSSIGVHKVKEEAHLPQALREAFRFDRKVLVERAISAREIECAVLGNSEPQASIVGEVVPNAEFYSYSAKYLDDNGAALVIPADLTASQTAAVRDLAIRAFTALELEGMARVDFFLDRNDGGLYVNEVNTIPGFTEHSMYPKLWEASGVGYSQLLDRLIELALERHRERSALLTRRGE